MFIQINLLPGPKKRKRAAGPSFSLDEVKALVAKVQDPLLLGAIGAWMVVVAFIVFMFVTTNTRVAGLEQQVTAARDESARFQTLLDQKEEAEDLRDSLVKELTAIRGIDADRFVWPHVLDEITRALPDFTWLTDVGMLAPAQVAAAPSPPRRGGQPAVAQRDTAAVKPAVRVQITGRASDIGGYTQFLRALANSPWLTGIEPGATRTEIIGDEARPVYGFSITATFRQADSAFIQTVPVRESIVR